MKKISLISSAIVAASLAFAPVIVYAQPAPEKECKQESDNPEERCKPGAILATTKAKGGVSPSTVAAIAAAVAIAAAASGGSGTK